MLCFSRSLRVFLLLRCQKMLPSAIVNCDKNLFFSIKTDSHNVLLRFHGPLPLASTEGLLNTNWQYITVHISQTPPSHVYVPHLLIFCERLGSSLAAEIIFVMSGNVSTGLKMIIWNTNEHLPFRNVLTDPR